MKINFFCPRWGAEQLSWNDFFDKVKKAGYDGVEMGFSYDLSTEEKSEILEGLQKFQLKLIGQHWQTIDKDYETHCLTFAKHMYGLAAAKPLFINSQTGKDYFSEEQNIGLIQIADAIAKETGVSIIHETHRGKWSFAAHITKTYLEKYPTIRITLDLSHWCSVAETLLEDQTEALDIAILHTDHVHARVGYQEGPQVADPRAPEYQEALQHHLIWWDKIIALKQSQGCNQFSFTPEFGPYPYMPHLPYTNQPIANQWDVNAFMMQLLRERYAK